MSDKIDPLRFSETAQGSGAFGRWILDENGLPAYYYEMDQYRDPQARYTHSFGLDRRDHWHQIGNDRINALASNDGTVQVMIGDRGPIFLNRYEAEDPRTLKGHGLMVLRWAARHFYEFRKNRIAPQTRSNRILPDRRNQPATRAYTFAGGFSYVHDGELAWASAFRYRPDGAKTERIFGMGYVRNVTEYNGLRITRQIHAPTQPDSPAQDQPIRLDDPTLIIDVTIENTSRNTRQFHHYEYWDVNIHQVKLQWLRSGLSGIIGDEERQILNQDFELQINWDEVNNTLCLEQRAPERFRQPDRIGRIDWSPPGVFLADLSGRPDGVLVDKLRFFGTGDRRQPESVQKQRSAEALQSSAVDKSMPYCLVHVRKIELGPGEKTQLRYAYGAIPPGQDLSFLNRYRQANPVSQAQLWKNHLVYFDSGEDPVLKREMAWHAYYLLSATVYNRYYEVHHVPQGSAYYYLHGADGAPRDLALTALALTYLRPKLARETLCHLMMLRHGGTGALSYAFGGYGVHSDARGLHTKPSDLDLFFMLALYEYLAATGDMAFLNFKVDYYPRHNPNALPPGAQGRTVLDHLRAAATHLLNDVGLGDSDLLRIGSGDWSDAIVVETSLGDGPDGYAIENSKERGESIPSTQMALYILPRMADMIEAYDSALAEDLRGPLELLRAATLRYWNGEWFARAVLRDVWDNPVTVGEKQMDLEAQVWALIAEILGQSEEASLVESIRRLSDDDSPVGATLINGSVWPAISQLLTWGYVRHFPDLAWRSLERNCMASKAESFPSVWHNIWSGPDGIDSKKGDTWASPVTPVTDFPIMNSNLHAMSLLALIRVCGIEASAEGLIIRPRLPRAQFALDTPLISLDMREGRLRGVYHACVSGSRILHIEKPENAGWLSAKIGDTSLPNLDPQAATLPLEISFNAGDDVLFELSWQ